MDIFITIAGIDAASGGPSRSVPSLAHHLGSMDGIDVRLLTCLRSTDARAVGNDKYSLYYYSFDGSQLGIFRAVRRMRKDLSCWVREHAGRAVIHDQGIWLFNNHAAIGVAKKTGIPLVVSPRGMLEPWAINYKAFKKKLAWLLYQRNDLACVDLFHATSQQEAENILELGLRKPVAIIPNGITMPLCREKTRSADKKKTILFLSRIHPKKGLLNLVSAWRQVKGPGWKIVIAGPDESGHKEEVMKAINAAGVEDSFEFIGSVDDRVKWDWFFRADIFVLPTFSENFGIVVAEALACGVPVITTTGAPWQELQTHNCGWWIEIGVEPLAEALRSAIALTDEERCEMGKRGRKLVADRYSWTKIGRDMANVYAWVLGDGPKPDFIMNP